MLAVRSNERAAASIGIAVAAIKLGAFAPRVVPRRPRRCAHRLQPGPALAGVVRRVRRPRASSPSPTSAASRASAARSSPARSATLGIVYVIFDRHAERRRVLRAGQRAVADPDRHLQPGRHRRRRAATSRDAGQAARPSAARDGREPTSTRPVADADGARRPASRRRATIGDVLLETDDISVTYGGLRAVDRRRTRGPRRRDRRAHRPERRRQDELHRRHHRVHAVPGQVWLLGEPLGRRRRPRAGPQGPGADVAVGRAVRRPVGRRTTSASATTSATTPGRCCATRCGRTRRHRPPSRDAIALMSASSDVTDRKPSELPLGHQKASAWPARWRCGRRSCCSTSPPPASTWPRSPPSASTSREIAATGVGCLLVDHDMRLVLGVCDRVYVIEFGRLIASGHAGRGAPRPGGDRRLPRLRAPRASADEGSAAGLERGSRHGVERTVAVDPETGSGAP